MVVDSISLLAQARHRIESLHDARRDVGHELVVLSRRDAPEAIAVMAASFNGSETTDPEMFLDWVLGPGLRHQFAHPDRLAYFDFVMRWIFHTCEIYGMLVGVRDTATGELLAVTAMLPPGRTYVVDGSSFFRPHVLAIITRVGKLPPEMWSPRRFAPNTGARMDAFLAATSTLHHDLTATSDREGHYYVFAVCVSPKAQGRGCARTMLDAISATADGSGHLCYLEANSEKNANVYARLGYAVLVRHSHSVSARLLIDGDPPPDTRCMVRPARLGRPAALHE